MPAQFIPNEIGFVALERELAEFERNVADRIAEIARGTVAVLTGETRDSITVVEIDGHAQVQVGGAGVILEVGRASQAPEPFLYPAAVQAAGEVPAMAARDLGARP